MRHQALDSAQRLGQREAAAARRRTRLTAACPPRARRSRWRRSRAAGVAPARAPGATGRPGYQTRCTLRLLHPAIRPAPGHCGHARSRRACSVRRPRRVMKLSKGAPVSPRQLAHQHSCSCSSRACGHHRAADHVAVAVDVLGGRVHDEVGAEPQRLLPGRRQEGVVDHHQRAGRLGQRGHGGDVGDAQQRIARASRSTAAPPAATARARSAAASAKSTNSTCDLAAALPAHRTAGSCRRSSRAARRRARRTGSTWPHQRDGAHARGGDHGAGAAFQIGERVAEQIARRIAGARVIVGALLAVAAKGVGRAQVDRRHHRAGDCHRSPVRRAPRASMGSSNSLTQHSPYRHSNRGLSCAASLRKAS